jgi:hypothetical protein
MSDVGGKRNPWLAHVKKTMKAHKGMKFGQVLKMAKKTYKKGGMHGGGGVSGATEGTSSSTLSGGLLSGATPVGGRRRTRKSRRGGSPY